MKIILSIAIFIVSLVGCQTERPTFKVMQLSVINNKPCFLIPADIAGKKDRLVSNGIMVSFLDGSHWKTISPSGVNSAERSVSIGECTQWPDIEWKPGEYSVLMRVNNTSKENSTRLRSDFTLTIDESGKISYDEK
jgi:hypothetical protein